MPTNLSIPDSCYRLAVIFTTKSLILYWQSVTQQFCHAYFRLREKLSLSEQEVTRLQQERDFEELEKQKKSIEHALQVAALQSALRFQIFQELY